MTPSDFSLIAVFFTGLLGGVHCAGMCGGIVSALGMMRQKPMATIGGIAVNTAAMSMQGASAMPAQPSTLVSVSFYNLGRISMYTVLGLLAGAIGSTAWLMDSMLPIQQVAFFVTNILVILMGLYILGVRRIATVVESLGARVWQFIRPFATRRLGGAGALNAIMAGALWGMVPCGMVYAVLGAALVSGSAVHGGLLMLVFGLGTLPNLMVLGLSGQWLAKASRHKLVRWIAGAMIIGFGLMGLMHLSMPM